MGNKTTAKILMGINMALTFFGMTSLSVGLRNYIVIFLLIILGTLITAIIVAGNGYEESEDKLPLLILGSILSLFGAGILMVSGAGELTIIGFLLFAIPYWLGAILFLCYWQCIIFLGGFNNKIRNKEIVWDWNGTL